MQVLKDEVRQKILGCARETFLEYGFESASMRQIAEKVGVSVGNMYRYFPNKEALFEAIVKPAYDSVLELVETHNQIAEEEAAKQGTSIMEQVGQLLTELLAVHRESLLILIVGSKGTRYEHAKEDLVDSLTAHMQEHLCEFQQRKGLPGDSVDVSAARPIAVAFIEGYFEIVKSYTDQQKISSCTRQYVNVWFQGLQSFM